MKVPSCAHRMGKSPQKSLEGLVLKGWTKKQKPSPWIIWMASLAQSLRGAWSAKRYCQDLTKFLKSVWNHQLINVDHGTKERGIGQIKIYTWTGWTTANIFRSWCGGRNVRIWQVRAVFTLDNPVWPLWGRRDQRTNGPSRKSADRKIWQSFFESR